MTLSTGAEIPANATGLVPKNITPVFGTVLAETVSDQPDSASHALIWPAPNKSERQVSMSYRVAASEQALIKASASAYLRQCALDVEKLRAQVHHFAGSDGTEAELCALAQR